MNYWDVLPFAEKWQEQHGGKPYTSVVELRPYQSDSDVGDYYITDAGAWIRYADWGHRQNSVPNSSCAEA